MANGKLKSHRGAKKRFKISATGLVISPQAGKRHNMRKRSNKFIRNNRGTTILPDCCGSVVKKYMRLVD